MKEKNSREKVLHALLSKHRCSVNELAVEVGIHPISIRHHTDRLLAEGLIKAEEEKHGVGRPRQIYSLTENGMELFPSRYLQLTIRLLEQLKDNLPQKAVDDLFNQMADELVNDYSAQAKNQPMEERLNFLQELLTNEGFQAEWSETEDSYFIKETSCPYLHVGQTHPEVCSVDERLISQVLLVPAEKVKCMLHGDQFCTYLVSK